MVEKIIGTNIKIQRQKKGITLRNLAKSIDVSPSFLSQVETGKAVPSLLSLKKIADALHTTIGMLVGEDQNFYDHNAILKKEDRILLDNIGHRIKIELLAVQDVNKQMQPYIIDLNKNGDTGTFGQHSGQEAGFVLKGVVEIYYNNRTYILNVGDAFYINSNIPHHLKNINDKESQVLIVASVPRF